MKTFWVDSWLWFSHQKDEGRTRNLRVFSLTFHSLESSEGLEIKLIIDCAYMIKPP